MNRDFQVTARSFRIPITMAEYDAIDHCERDGFEVGRMLEKIPGVENVDYNGHFGMFIFLTIEKQYDNDNTLRAISEIIDREGNAEHYEIWSTGTSTTMTTSDKVPEMLESGMIETDAILELDFYAANWEKAQAIYEQTLEDLNE